MNATIRILLLLAAVAHGACSAGLPVPLPRDLAPPDQSRVHPSTPDLATIYRGRCFGLPNRVSCILASPDCGDGKCQEGVCCMGEINPDTCECRCNGGPACPADQMCCVGGLNTNLPDQGILKCRPTQDCYDGGP